MIRHRGILVLTVLSAGCSTLPEPGTVAEVTLDLPATISVATDKDVYARGEPISLALNLRNTGDRLLSLPFASAQRYDFVIRTSSGKTVWQWSAGRTFAQAQEVIELERGEEQTFVQQFEGQLPAGEYEIIGTLLVVNDTRSVRTSVVIQ